MGWNHKLYFALLCFASFNLIVFLADFLRQNAFDSYFVNILQINCVKKSI